MSPQPLIMPGLQVLCELLWGVKGVTIPATHAALPAHGETLSEPCLSSALRGSY